jgi:hypothetical protein
MSFTYPNEFGTSFQKLGAYVQSVMALFIATCRTTSGHYSMPIWLGGYMNSGTRPNRQLLSTRFGSGRHHSLELKQNTCPQYSNIPR